MIGSSEKPKKPAGLPLVMLVCALPGLAFLAWALVAPTQGPNFAEHVTAADAPFDLPIGASDVSYYRTGSGTVACEFTTDAASFRQWVDEGIGSQESQQAGVQITSIAGGARISRYYYFTPSLNGPEQAIVTQGLEYKWSFEDRGVHAVFDSTTDRAYYYSHSR